MINHTRVFLTALLLGLLATVAFPATALGIADPDSPPSVNSVVAYDLDDGGLGVLVEYFLDYAATPTETATEAYMLSFIDTDGTTILKTTAPYAFDDSGYGRGVIWIRFTATEVATYSLDSANIALHEVWLMGNPTLTWVPGPDPPKTIAGIDSWRTTGNMAVLLAIDVLVYADTLELEWSLDLIEETSIGNKLTALGSSYFSNAIPNLRILAPSAFASGEDEPDYVPVSYDTAFGAVATSGTATLVVSPDTLTEGSNVVDTGATVGTFTIDLAGWTYGTITNGTGTIAGTPFDLDPGVNTVTVTVAGTFTIEVAVVDTVTRAEDATIGTALDLTALGTAFGLSRWFVSGIVWILVTVIICAAIYRAEKDESGFGVSVGGSKVIILVFSVAVVIGALLGLLHPMVSALLFVGSGALIGYVFFFRSDALHKGLMFMVWMFVCVSIAGNMLAGSVSLVATRLTANVAEGTITSIAVASTEGFPDSGIIIIGDERIGYPSKTATTFDASTVGPLTISPILRGLNDTTDTAHLSGATVRTPEAGFLNASMDYRIATLADSAGTTSFLTMAAFLPSLIGTFFTLPLGFLGTDLAILTYIWGIVAIGMIFGIVTALVGGRRV